MSDDRKGSSRRDFLKLASTAAPAAAVAAVAGGDDAEAAANSGSATGYRKTEHVKKYLDSARF